MHPPTHPHSLSHSLSHTQGSAALHVASRLGFVPEQMMVAGDGENDLPLFEITNMGARGVVVSNACQRLKLWKEKEVCMCVCRGGGVR